MTALARSAEFVADSVAATRRRACGPDSNTGLNPQTPTRRGFALGVDFCSLVFSADMAVHLKLATVADVVKFLYPYAPLSVGAVESKRWQFYPESAHLFGPDGKLVGRLGMGGNGNTICVSLSGAGCALVDDWFCTSVQARQLRAHLSRVDLAFDDFEGQIFRDIREVNVWAMDGRFDAKTGRPAETYFYDDHNKGKGSTVYVGSRGRKQLCIYEKGKQLKDRFSPWIRCELRLWAADCVLPLEVLYSPLAFLRGSYALLGELLPGEADEAKPERVARTVKATAEAALSFLRNQCGPTLDLFVRALGPDVWPLLQERVLRSEVPRRFKGVARDLSSLRNIVRDQIGQSCDSVTCMAV